MYRTPCCSEKLSWWSVKHSNPLWPVSCPSCNKEYCDTASRITGWLLLVAVALVISIFYVDISNHTTLIISSLPTIFSILFVVSMIEEIVIVRKGALTLNAPNNVKRFKRKITAAGIILAMIIGYEIASAL